MIVIRIKVHCWNAFKRTRSRFKGFSAIAGQKGKIAVLKINHENKS